MYGALFDGFLVNRLQERRLVERPNKDETLREWREFAYWTFAPGSVFLVSVGIAQGDGFFLV